MTTTLTTPTAPMRSTDRDDGVYLAYGWDMWQGRVALFFTRLRWRRAAEWAIRRMVKRMMREQLGGGR